MTEFKPELIHDLQKAYRKVLDCMARPGKIQNISMEAAGIQLSDKCYPSTFLVAMMLLDSEVSFNMVSNFSEEVSKLINRITYSRIACAVMADYIFILSEANVSDCEKAFELASIGEPADPQRSATIIIETCELSEYGDITLSGPGIRDKTYVSITGYTGWIKKRKEKNSMFPLGTDIILIDNSSCIMCLPRTTVMEVIA